MEDIFVKACDSSQLMVGQCVVVTGRTCYTGLWLKGEFISMASKNKNEDLDDCIRNVNNETFRHLNQGGNLNTLQEAKQEKKTTNWSDKCRKYSVDSWLVMQGMMKNPIARRASCIPSIFLPRIPSAANSHPSWGKRRHSHAGIPSAPSTVIRGMAGTMPSKHRRKSMISLATDNLTTAHQTLGHVEMRTMFSSQARLQEVDEGSDSGQGIPVLPPLQENLFPEGGAQIQEVDEKKIFKAEQDSSPDHPMKDGDYWSGLPRSASFVSCEQIVNPERPGKKSRSASFCLPSAGRQRKKAVSYGNENYPILEHQTLSAEDLLGASQDHRSNQLPHLDFERRESSSDNSTTDSISICDEEFIEEPLNLFLSHTSFHMALLQPAAPQHSLNAKMVCLPLTDITNVKHLLWQDKRQQKFL